ncbi:MAG: DUF6174 domain-containing protein [Flavobacteriaceae bacterium]
MNFKIVFLLVFTLFLKSCVKNIEIIPEDELTVYEKKWAQQELRDYQFILQITCFCIEEYTRPKTVVVKNNEVISVDGTSIAEWSDPSFRTIDDFFKYIREIQSQNPARESLKFDEVKGYPTYIFFDIDERIADEEIGYTISDLVAN